MGVPHLSFPQPEDRNVKIWRYMDLSKFLHLIQSNSLYLSPASELGDPWEGSVPPMNKNLYQRLFEMNPENEVLKQGFANGMFQGRDERNTEQRILMRQHVCVSCWHMSDVESAAMWRLYGTNNESICIQSTYDILDGLLPSDVFLGKVRYILYSDDQFIDPSNTFNPFMTKRLSFEHEKEVRVAFLNNPHGELPPEQIEAGISRVGSGASINIDVNKLIENVFVNPESPLWFEDVVANVVKRYGVSATVRQSNMKDSPVF